MRILALVPARGGSKRLPGKNVKLLGGEPLIAWTIKAAQKSCACVDVMVSTDDLEISEVSRRYGAYIPSMRPPALATDESTSVDVALHALAEYERVRGPVDGLLLLQPTSPFRTAETIKKAIVLFEKGGGRSPVVSVGLASEHPAWCYRIINGQLKPFVDAKKNHQRSQDLELAYVLNGSIYLIAPALIREHHTFLTDETRPLLIDDPLEGIDIDTDFDWTMAECALLKKNFTS